MTEGSWYFSRVHLRSDASVRALLPLLIEEKGEPGSSLHPGHRLIWSLFADGSDRRRDFLWREKDRGSFLILSARAPQDHHALFHVEEPKRFEPALREGDRLGFSLHANPVVRRSRKDRPGRSKHDVVMDGLRTRPSGAGRAEDRLSIMRERGFSWLDRQAQGSGFLVKSSEVSVDSYQHHRVSRKHEKIPISFATLDFEGLLEVGDPDLFLSTVKRGFGSSKAYGCGLMLLRRA